MPNKKKPLASRALQAAGRLRHPARRRRGAGLRDPPGGRRVRESAVAPRRRRRVPDAAALPQRAGGGRAGRGVAGKKALSRRVLFSATTKKTHNFIFGDCLNFQFYS